MTRKCEDCGQDMAEVAICPHCEEIVQKCKPKRKKVKKELCVDKVLKFLKENPKFFKPEKIAVSVGHSSLTVKKSLTALRKEGKVGLYLHKWWGLKDEGNAIQHCKQHKQHISASKLCSDSGAITMD